MLINLKDNNISFAEDYDSKKAYNIKDIRISVPIEPSVSDIAV